MNLCITIFLCLICLFNELKTLTDEERKEFLKIHNYLRRAVVPPAADMQELVYDEKIEDHVNAYLENCKFEHRGLNNYGENGRLSNDHNITNSVMSWFQERVYFNISSVIQRCAKANSKHEYLYEVECGHYQMLVKSTLKSLGCGYKYCQRIKGKKENFTHMHITFCFYNSGLLDHPYKVGSACSSCESDYQFCHDGMCVPKERYDKNSRSCKLRCQNCAKFFDPKNSCLCDCPDGTNSSDCRGIPKVTDNTCSPCKSLFLSCHAGEEVKEGNKCLCKCKTNYQGEYCKVKTHRFNASYLHLIDGLPWRYGMNMPVNIAEFENSFPAIRRTILLDLREFCIKNTKFKKDCDYIMSVSMTPNNVQMVPDSLSMHPNGSLSFRMFLNYSKTLGGIINEFFVPTSILGQIWKQRSLRFNELYDNFRQINQTKIKVDWPPNIYATKNSEKEINTATPNSEDTNAYSLDVKTSTMLPFEITASNEFQQFPSTESKSETSTESKSETSTESKSETSTERKTEMSTGRKSETSTERKPESSTERKLDTSTERKLETSIERKLETSTERKLDTSTERKLETSTERMSDTRTDIMAEANTGGMSGTSTEKMGKESILETSIITSTTKKPMFVVVKSSTPEGKSTQNVNVERVYLLFSLLLIFYFS